jgi:hypothetical protein
VRLYLRSRHVGAVIVAMAVMATGSALGGGKLLTLVASGDPITMPYRYVLTLFIAAVAVASLTSPIPQTDRMDTGPLRRMRRVHLLVLLVVTVAFSFLSEQLTANGEPWEAVRSCLCWYGLALISGALLRESFAWVVPMAVMFPLVWWGSATGSPAAWNWATAPVTESASWLVTIGSLTLGVVMFLRLRAS